MTWEFEVSGGDDVSGHPVPGTKKYSVTARVVDSKAPHPEVARVTDLEVKVNQNGVYPDLHSLQRQVDDKALRASFVIELKSVLPQPTAMRTYRHQLRAEDGLRWQGTTPADNAFRVKVREQIEKATRNEGYAAGDTIVVWAEDVGQLDSWRLD